MRRPRPTTLIGLAIVSHLLAGTIDCGGGKPGPSEAVTPDAGPGNAVAPAVAQADGGGSGTTSLSTVDAGPEGGAPNDSSSADEASTAFDAPLSADVGPFHPTVGPWRGMTSQSQAISLSLDATGVSSVSIFMVDPSGCRVGRMLRTFALLDGGNVTPSSFPIMNDTFTTGVTGPTKGDTSVQGTFDSASSASGKWSFVGAFGTANDCMGSASGTWTAAPASGDGG